MKTLFILFGIILLPLYAASRCSFGCSCINDDSCDYYCRNFTCQESIPLWRNCSGYYVHPRECGIISYCDPQSGFTCQLQKNYGEQCTYSYSCLSDYCDSRTWTCEYKYDTSPWIVPIFLPSLVGLIIFVTFVLVIIRYRARRRALAYYQTPYVVMPSSTPCSYQNACLVGEGSPPPYPGPHAAPLTKTYQS